MPSCQEGRAGSELISCQLSVVSCREPEASSHRKSSGKPFVSGLHKLLKKSGLGLARVVRRFSAASGPSFLS